MSLSAVFDSFFVTNIFIGGRNGEKGEIYRRGEGVDKKGGTRFRIGPDSF